MIVNEAIEETFELASDGRGDIDLKFSIEGLDKYNLDSATLILSNIATVKSLGIPSPTLLKELYTEAADIVFPHASQEVKDKIRQEIEEAVDKRPEPPAAPTTDAEEDPASEEDSSAPYAETGTTRPPS